MCAGPSTSAAAADDDEDDCMIVEPKVSKKPVAAKPVTAEVSNDTNTKRKRAADDPAGPGVKTRMKKPKSDDNVITLD